MRIINSIALFIVLHFTSSAQEVLLGIPDTGKTVASFIPNGYDTLETVSGDLNRDGIVDIVLALRHVDEDSFEMDKEPRRILLVLIKANKGYKLIGRSDHVLLCKGCGGFYGDPFAALEIKKGVLSISHYGGSAWRWLEVRKFRVQQNRTYLIGATSDYYWNVSDCDGKGRGVGDAGRKYRDVNFVTGDEELIERTEECTLIKQVTQKIKRKPLVKLEDFNFDEKY